MSSGSSWDVTNKLSCVFMKNEEHVYIKYISHFIFERGPQFVVSLRERERDGETYTQRGDFFLCHIFFREPTLAPSCKPYRQRRPRRLCSTPDSLPLSKSDRGVITWSPSGYTPVGPDCSDALPSPCLLITTWQLVKAHGVTRNEPKIHVICYITQTIRFKVVYIKAEFSIK